MKRLLLLLCLPLLLSPGCVNAPVTQDIGAIANIATYTGVSLDLDAHPERREAYVAALKTLDLMLKDGTTSPSTLAEALRALPVKELSGRKGTLLVGAAVTLYTRAMQRVDIDKVELAGVVAKSVRDGLSDALGN